MSEAIQAPRVICVVGLNPKVGRLRNSDPVALQDLSIIPPNDVGDTQLRGASSAGAVLELQKVLKLIHIGYGIGIGEIAYVK